MKDDRTHPLRDSHQDIEEVKRIPMSKPSGKYNVWNKITFSEGTSH